jgi:uncharacterized protein (DUF2062 family)
MFRRRTKVHPLSTVRDFFWPKIGWVRSTYYLYHRVGRLAGSPYAIAAGFACGAAISFTPFVGLHLALSALSAWIIRANVIAALLGTVVGNPWTFPFIWIWIYKLGIWLGGPWITNSPENLDFPKHFANILKAFLEFDLSYLAQNGWPIFAPMLIGGIPTAIIVGFICYFALKPVISSYQSARLARRVRNRQRKENTEVHA